MPRNNVVGATRIPSLGASPAPPSPPVANPSACKAARKRFVMRAQGWTRSGRCSVKIWRGQLGVRQKNLRTSTDKLTGFEPQAHQQPRADSGYACALKPARTADSEKPVVWKQGGHGDQQLLR